MNNIQHENVHGNRPKFSVEYCKRCKVTKLLPVDEVWDHACTNPKHQMIWLNELHVGCVGCSWRRSRPNRHELRPHNLLGMWEAAHRETLQGSSVPSQ